MKKLILFVLLVATFWSCDNYFGEKTDLSFIEVPTYSNRDIAYVPIEPSFRGFVRPTNITIGFDELIYIVDEGTEEIVCYDEAANEQGRFFIPGLTFVTQDRRLNLLAIGTYDTIVNGVNYSLSTIYRINQYSVTGYGLTSAKITKSIVHPFYFKNSEASPPPSLRSANYSLNLVISSWYSLSSASLGSSLIFGLFLMFFAREAYLKVFMVSSKL